MKTTQLTEYLGVSVEDYVHWFGHSIALKTGLILWEKFYSNRGDGFPCVKASMSLPICHAYKLVLVATSTLLQGKVFLTH